MAVYHHIPDEKLLKEFPELSLTESHIMVLYSLGMAASTIASLQNKSPKTVNNHLANIKMKLSTDSIFDLRTVFNIRILLKALKDRSKYGQRLFPQLSIEQEEILLSFTSGVSEREIAFGKKISENEINSVLTAVAISLDADHATLRTVVCMKLTEHLLNTL